MRQNISKIILILFLAFVSWNLYYYSFAYARFWHLFMSHNLSDGEYLLTKNADMRKSKEYIYDLKYKYFNVYGVKFYFPCETVKDKLGINYKNYSGKFSIELLHNNKIIRKKIITRPYNMVLCHDLYDSSGNYIRHSDSIKYIQLDNFSLPYEGIYKNLKLKITILESDSIFIEEDVDIYLGISAI